MLSEVRSPPAAVRHQAARSPAVKATPSPSPGPAPVAPAHAGRTAQARSASDHFGVGTYNLAAGNAEHGTPANFDRTKKLAAQQIVSGGVDVLAFQEVGVNGRNTRGRDNNEQVLEEVFRQELPPGFSGADIDKVSLGRDGRPVLQDGQAVYDPARYADSRYTATADNGQTRNMTLSRERYDDQGREIPFSSAAKEGHTTVYSAHLEEQDKTYSLAYASNNDQGSYGNSVLLAPGYEIENVEQKVLGHDYDDHEQRSALAVTFTTPQGQEATAVSAHLSNGREQAQGESRIPQMRNLSSFADGFDNAIVLGDYNSYPGQSYGRGTFDFLPFVDPDKTASASSFGFVDPDRGVRSIDRVYTQGDVTISSRHDFDEASGGSDHGLVTWDVRL